MCDVVSPMAFTLMSRNALASGSAIRINDKPDASAFRLSVADFLFGQTLAGGYNSADVCR